MGGIVGGQAAAVQRDAGRATGRVIAGGLRGWRMTLLAIALAGGITVGWRQTEPYVWSWLAVAAAAAGCGAAAGARRSRFAMPLLMVSAAALGAGWVTLRQHYAVSRDLSVFVGDEQMLVRIRGVADKSPVMRDRTAGSMARFDYRQPATYFPVSLNALLARDGREMPITGKALVRVDESLAPLTPGDEVEVMGFLMRPAEPRNPGEFDYRRYARSLGQAGFLSVPSRELVRVTPAQRGRLGSMAAGWRERFQRRASAWLLADLPQTDRTQRDHLLANLLLGQREEQIDGFYEAFQRVGLAHVLAISGFHLSVLAGFVLLLARLIGGFRRWHGLLVIGIVLVYLVMVEVHMPVLRAGVMTIAGSLGLVFGRRLRVSGLVALSAMLLLLWRPDQLFNAGFQLTYGVVLGLVHLEPAVRRRFRKLRGTERSALTTGQMIGRWTALGAIASVVAWLIATPIVAYHFGMFSPLGALLSIVAVPLSAVILGMGYLKIVLSAILPSAALLLGIPLSIGVDVLLAIVTTIDSVPGSVVHVPYPSVAWTLLAVVCVCWSALVRGLRAFKIVSLAALAAWLMWPAWGWSRPPALRIDMLSVGDGSCFVVRSGDGTALFDAGSSSDLNVGERSLIPALRRLGVRGIDAIAISHADLDHYSAVLELAEEFDVGEVMVTPQFAAEAHVQPYGPVSWLMEGLTRQRVSVVEISAGYTRRFGDSQWTWLHPPPEIPTQHANDSSMVVRIEAHGKRALLCGDIEAPTMRNLLARDREALKANIAELPHHGSYHDAAVEFVRAIDPAVLMQSTGWMRWKRDRWALELAHRQRLVSARDGACWVEVNDDGGISTGRFLERAYEPKK